MTDASPPPPTRDEPSDGTTSLDGDDDGGAAALYGSVNDVLRYFGAAIPGGPPHGFLARLAARRVDGPAAVALSEAQLKADYDLRHRTALRSVIVAIRRLHAGRQRWIAAGNALHAGDRAPWAALVAGAADAAREEDAEAACAAAAADAVMSPTTATTSFGVDRGRTSSSLSLPTADSYAEATAEEVAAYGGVATPRRDDYDGIERLLAGARAEWQADSHARAARAGKAVRSVVPTFRPRPLTGYSLLATHS